eukprot:CAMPEP_0168346738 /NCGR_PEP_ID=MMETSP0213-20121227/18500_1 /TAXON_ID=151035 /ORGANISM="Euplotes harpa, Strain FSP1.4" /LENGTH=55 /DNA_ID=CAMNT_0008355547 /DNA_START=1 /DNA_END=164 /DNA_ORIENTATION=-
MNTGNEIKMKMSAYNYISGSQSIKLKVDVTNSAANVGTDIIEFFVSEAPYDSKTT